MPSNSMALELVMSLHDGGDRPAATASGWTLFSSGVPSLGPCTVPKATAPSLGTSSVGTAVCWDGVLLMHFRQQRQKSNTPTVHPIVIPAIAPTDRPLSEKLTNSSIYKKKTKI